ncbi:MAG: flagellar protein FliS [Gammaproteobacteria bacterium]|nr:MAG: flagellar protein FliS [Gammaproteobacteria bacterium]
MYRTECHTSKLTESETMYPHQHRISQQYRQTQVMTADPLQLVIMAYDLAIVGCQERNLLKVTSALDALKDALNHEEGGQVAANLLSLYLYLADEARSGNFEQVGEFLRELRQTWATARQQIILQPEESPVLEMAA